MNGMMCFIVLDPEGGQLIRLSANQFKSLLVGRSRLKSFAGKTVRAAIVWIPIERKEARTDSAQAVYPFLRFKTDGTLDRQYVETARKEVERLGSLDPPKPAVSNVINATKIFEAKRVSNLYTWSPSDKMVEEIVAVLNEQVAGW